MGRYSYKRWPKHVPVADRRREAEEKIAKLKKSGRKLSPVTITGAKIAHTFWGKAWCKNLENYSDYSNRLPRGRSYLKNKSVFDLQVSKGRVKALVNGTKLYKVDIKIKALPQAKWRRIKEQCTDRIGSLVELLQGALSNEVMEIITRAGEGLFPAPKEITLSCSCPDWAYMCKHVAAALYGVGVRLDEEPELLFLLRGVDPAEMVEAALDQPVSAPQGRALETDDLSSIFGVDIKMGLADTSTVKASPKKKAARKKAVKTKSQPSRSGKTIRESRQSKKGIKILSQDFPKAWDSVGATVLKGSGKSYDQACMAIVDLYHAYSIYSSREAFKQDLSTFMKKHMRRKAFIGRLVIEGLWP